MTATPEPSTGTPSWSVDEGSRVVSAAAVGFLSAAVVISAMYTRESGDLDWSNFVVGALASAGLIGFAALSAVLRPGTLRSAVVAWPGAAGIAGAGVMVGIAIDQDPAAVYTSSLLVLGLSVTAYLATRGAAFVLSGLAGLAVLYAQAFSDVFDDLDLGDDKIFMIIGGAIVAFVIVVTAAGWFLSGTRVLTGVVAGAIGVVGLTGVLYFIFISRTIAVFSEFDSIPARGSGDGPDVFPSMESFREAFDRNPYADDVTVTLIYGGVLLVFWSGCAAITGHAGFRLLAVAISVVLVPVSTAVLTVQHPTWWSVGVAALGGLLLLAVLFRRPGRPAPAPGHGETASPELPAQ